ncbi:MAG: amidohydrolase [Planctomycetes bacterium]|nr:amidohydrolase [Planctomycetota bacterium]
MRYILSLLMVASAIAYPASLPALAQSVDTIYHGGPIVTVNDAQPSAEALAVKDGRITAVGLKDDVLKLKGEKTKIIDLKGKTLVPGFVDGHAHFLGFGSQAVGANLLAPPDGTVNNIDDVVAKLQEFAKGPDVNRTGWIFGIGYDDAVLAERRHPTRDDLDRVSKDVPVIAVHISGHFSAMNSAGLKKIGYTAETPNPRGGVIRRRPGSQEPNGVLEELASIPHMIPAINAVKPEDKDYFLKRGLELAKSYGYTTANEGRCMGFQHLDLVSAARRGILDIDVLSYMDYTAKKDLEYSFSKSEYVGRYRVAGMKITLDGSPQGRTAWRTKPYLLPPDGQSEGYKGYPAIPDTKLIESLFDEAYQKSWPVKVHANGDAAIDQMIEALKPVHQKYGSGDRRHVLIHGQFVRQDQLDSLNELQVIPSLFPMHTFYWGDWYDQIIGPELAQQISPMRSAIKRGMRPTSHTDAPVALPNLMQVMSSTVNRVSRSGKVMGPDERTTPLEALKAITLWGAHQHFEEKNKGSLEVGKLADMVILDRNPLTVDPLTIKDIKVVETIKEGKTVYTAK